MTTLNTAQQFLNTFNKIDDKFKDNVLHQLKHVAAGGKLYCIFNYARWEEGEYIFSNYESQDRPDYYSMVSITPLEAPVVGWDNTKAVHPVVEGWVFYPTIKALLGDISNIKEMEWEYDKVENGVLHFNVTAVKELLTILETGKAPVNVAQANALGYTQFQLFK